MIMLLILKEIKKFIKGYTIVTNIFGIQEYDSVMCGYFCIGFLDFMVKGCVCYIFSLFCMSKREHL